MKRYKSTIDYYEKQHARDSMIIKFRDSTIARSNNIIDQASDEDIKEEVQHLNQEIRMLHDQLSENPKLANAITENEELKAELERVKKENSSADESYCALYKSSLGKFTNISPLISVSYPFP